MSRKKQPADKLTAHAVILTNCTKESGEVYVISMPLLLCRNFHILRVFEETRLRDISNIGFRAW